MSKSYDVMTRIVEIKNEIRDARQELAKIKETCAYEERLQRQRQNQMSKLNALINRQSMRLPSLEAQFKAAKEREKADDQKKTAAPKKKVAAKATVNKSALELRRERTGGEPAPKRSHKKKIVATNSSPKHAVRLQIPDEEE